MPSKWLRLTLVKSIIGLSPKQEGTVKALGLRRIRQQVTHDDNVVIRGTVNEVVDRILALRETAGDFGTLLYCGKDWTDVALGRRSMELMAEKVMPAVNAALGRRVAAE